MRNSKYKQPLETLCNSRCFSAADAYALGIPARMLAYYCKKGVIERLNRGFYRGFEAEGFQDWGLEELVLTAASIPHGVVCLLSALCFYGMTDQIMREYWIAVPNGRKCPVRPHARIVRLRNMSLGQTTVSIEGFDLKIFDRERTVLDAFRFLSEEIAIKSLQSYLKPADSFKPDLVKLERYAKELKTNITPYLLALTT